MVNRNTAGGSGLRVKSPPGGAGSEKGMIIATKVYLTSLGPTKFGFNSFIFHPISKYQPALDSSRFSASSDVHYAV